MHNRFRMRTAVGLITVLGTVSALAGGSEYLMANPGQNTAAPSASPSSSHYKFYVQANVGYGHLAYNDLAASTALGEISGAEDGGFAYGLTAGFNLNSMIGFQAGWLHLPGTQYTLSGSSYSVSSWLLYAATTLSVPYRSLSSLYLLLGMGYRDITNTAPFGNGNDVDLLFGVGAKYPLFSSLHLGLEYLHQPGTFSGDAQGRAPNANVFLTTLDYSFSM